MNTLLSRMYCGAAGASQYVQLVYTDRFPRTVPRPGVFAANSSTLNAIRDPC